jgi:hypothetical protein
MKAPLLLFLSLVAAAAAEPPMREAGTLIVYILTVESSYSKNFERPAGEKFDTLQWWIGAHGAWRIKTYAVDADIHPHYIDAERAKEEFIQLAFENSKKHYGDIVQKRIVVDVPAGASDASIAELLKKEGLRAEFEWVEAGYLLWLPDASKYVTKTKEGLTSRHSQLRGADAPPRG